MLHENDKVMVIAPSKSMDNLSYDVIDAAKKNLENLKLEVLFAKNVFNSTKYYKTASIKDRIEDINEAFKREDIKLVLTAIGGYNSNQLLDYIDYDLIRSNPKYLCGFSDITVILNAIYKKTSLKTYYGPHFSSFGMLKYFDYSKYMFNKMFFENNCCLSLIDSDFYSDDKWYLNQYDRKLLANPKMSAINNGYAEGTIVGGNLNTFNLLLDTEYMPIEKDIILFLEDNDLSSDFMLVFDRNLQALFHSSLSKHIRGIVVGRTQIKSDMNIDKWNELIHTKCYLSHIPVIINAPFGHTTPIATFPIGGKTKILANNNNCKINIYR